VVFNFTRIIKTKRRKSKKKPKKKNEAKEKNETKETKETDEAKETNEQSESSQPRNSKRSVSWNNTLNVKQIENKEDVGKENEHEMELQDCKSKLEQSETIVKTLTVEIEQLKHKKDELEYEQQQETRLLHERLRQMEDSRSAPSPFNVDALSQLQLAQKRLDMEINSKSILQQYVKELEKELDSMKQQLPGKQFKNLLFIQLFLWMIVIILLIAVLFRRQTSYADRISWPPS